MTTAIGRGFLSFSKKHLLIGGKRRITSGLQEGVLSVDISIAG
jgi:hypothetical protein